MERKESKCITFFKWMRNGVAFCFTWLVLLLLIRNLFLGIEVISTESLGKIWMSVCGGVLLFTIFFSGLFLKKIEFVIRLTCFMFLIGLYESVCFYWLGIFTEQGSFGQWLLFGGIIVSLYAISMIIYEIYSRKKAVTYTHALHHYQEKRGIENGTSA